LSELETLLCKLDTLTGTRSQKSLHVCLKSLYDTTAVVYVSLKSLYYTTAVFFIVCDVVI